MMNPYKVLAYIPEWDVTFEEAMAQIALWQKEMPDHEIFMDGDSYSICAMKKA